MFGRLVERASRHKEIAMLGPELVPDTENEPNTPQIKDLEEQVPSCPEDPLEGSFGA